MEGNLINNYFYLTAQVALATGASSRLSLQFINALRNQDAKLSLRDRSKEKLKK